ncbi:MAG: hypothetical protein IVW51_02260 [Thermaceae bacterium]|nr:hypothetical protein [Thermaceae bacterium]
MTLIATTEVVRDKLIIADLYSESSDTPEYQKFPFMPIILPWPEFDRAVSRLRIREGWAYWRFPKKAPAISE